MNYPSIKRIMKLEILQHEGGDTKAKAKTIRMLMDGSLDPVTGEIVKPHRINDPYSEMKAIDKELNTYGVEFIKEKNVNVMYCNTGDSDCETIIYDYDKNRWLITSFG